MVIKILPSEKGNTPNRLADAELHFDKGPLAGLKIVGFAIWKRHQPDGRHQVTFPARQFSVNGENRSIAIVRPIDDGSGHNRVRDLILEAYAAYEKELRENPDGLGTDAGRAVKGGK